MIWEGVGEEEDASGFNGDDTTGGFDAEGEDTVDSGSSSGMKSVRTTRARLEAG